VTVNETAGAGRHLAEPGAATSGPDDLVTRLLCAACYLYDDIADSAAAALLVPSRRALSPNWQVDVVALARHAARAQRLRSNRDTWLNRAIWYVIGAVFLGLLLTVSGAISFFHLVVLVMFLVGWAYLVAVGLVYHELRASRRHAVNAVNHPEVDPPERLPRRSTEEALRDLNHCNTVIHRADGSPFVGSGVKLDGWQITVDISSRTGPEFEPVTGAELQAALLELLPARITPRPSAVHRLYVRGGTGALGVELYRCGPVDKSLEEEQNFRRPVTRVSPAQMRAYFDRRDENARIYTCFQQSSWGGQVVVTLFVRAHVDNRTLFVEGQVHALRPLQPELYEVSSLQTGTLTELTELGPLALSTASSFLLNAPTTALRNRRAARLVVSNANEAAAEIAQRRDVDFGAVRSVRELVTNFELGDHFAAADEELYYQVFVRRAMECIDLFLSSRGVDTTEFAGQSAQIIAKTTANARSLYGAGTAG